jgi:glutathione peroxidase
MHMPYRLLFLLTFILTVFPTVSAAEEAPISGPLDFTLTDIDGKAQDLKQYQGKVLLLVNVASKCGLTPQYQALEKIAGTYGERGLVVIGIPANNFRGQEPGTNAEIKAFCSSTYAVSFPLMAKVSVLGDDICPLYAWLTTHSSKPGPIEWNFAKFLIGRDGQVCDRFHPKMTPDSPELIKAVEAALDTP